MSRREFLTAEWRDIVMLNYMIDPAVLRPLVPPGTELDFFRGDTFLSVVGFRFLNTRAFGVAFPFHRTFEEVNLRFYVRRCVDGAWRRGVVFISELVPRRAVAFVARTFYGEPYRALPMCHRINETTGGRLVEYSWRRCGRWENVRAIAEGDLHPTGEGSLEEFITEHYWGYTARGSACSEYNVQHPRWQIWRAREPAFTAEVSSLYGEAFSAFLNGPPASAFIADGSAVAVSRPL